VFSDWYKNAKNKSYSKIFLDLQSDFHNSFINEKLQFLADFEIIIKATIYWAVTFLTYITIGIIIFISEMKKLRFMDVNKYIEGHKIAKDKV
jgi:hypothetical protein